MKLSSCFCTCEANQIGGRDHGNVVESEASKVKVRANMRETNSDGNDWPENVDSAGGSTRGTPADLEEVARADAGSTALSTWLNTANRRVIIWPLHLEG